MQNTIIAKYQRTYSLTDIPQEELRIELDDVLYEYNPYNCTWGIITLDEDDEATFIRQADDIFIIRELEEELTTILEEFVSRELDEMLYSTEKDIVWED
jgi:hypothetical protein